jgi:hypothetical protein
MDHATTRVDSSDLQLFGVFFSYDLHQSESHGGMGHSGREREGLPSNAIL